MSRRTATRPIDVSVHLLWSDEIEAGCELMGGASTDPFVDDARARRLQVLIAESISAGVPYPTIVRIYVDWAREVLPELDADRGVLETEITAAESILAGTVPSGGVGAPRNIQDLSRALHIAHELNDATDCLAYELQEGLPTGDAWPTGSGAWVKTAAMLVAIVRAAGPDVLDRCAELAYARLFPVQYAARVQRPRRDCSCTWSEAS